MRRGRVRERERRGFKSFLAGIIFIKEYENRRNLL